MGRRQWGVWMTSTAIDFDPVCLRTFKGWCAKARAERFAADRRHASEVTAGYYREMHVIVNGEDRGLASPDFENNLRFEVRSA